MCFIIKVENQVSKLVLTNVLYNPKLKFDRLHQDQHNWSVSIFNTFRCDYMNAFVEGINSNVKALKSIVYGYRILKISVSEYYASMETR